MRVFPRFRASSSVLFLALAVLAAPTALAKQPKQDVCHLDADSGTYSILNVAAPAVPVTSGTATSCR